MQDEKLEKLMKTARKMTENETPNDKLMSLTRALELFSHETDRLANAYNSLKEEFTEIHHELEDANIKLTKKVAELNMMAFYLDTILSNISQGILFIDLNGDITTFNATAEKILEVSSNDVLYCTFWSHFTDDHFGFSMRQALATGMTPSSIFTTIKAKDGSNRELEVNTTFVCEEGKPGKGYNNEVSLKKMEGIIIILRDITDIRGLQFLANRNDRMKELGEMAAMVAHEIRNPLGGIKGFASLLRRDLHDQPEKAKMADYIIEGTDTLNRLVTNVLNYSRPIEPKLEKANIIELLSELKQHFDADTEAGNQVVVEIKTLLKEVYAHVDPQLIKSAILNLLVNARQAMPEGGKIDVHIKKENNYIIIQICDEGEGIPKENLEKIFHPFFTTKTQGNGFGLAEVHKVVQAHQGDIEVLSEVHKGTMFTIKLKNKDN